MSGIPGLRPNARLFGKLALLACAMFGFGFALVPLYRSICEITGINSLTRVDEGARRFAGNAQVDTTRTLRVEFDANTRGALQLRPRAAAVSVHPGELVSVEYELVNTLPRESHGQAIPSYMPAAAARWFRKIECFCFQQQTLRPREHRVFPVVFVIDPAVPRDVSAITLSYTFFEVTQPVPPNPRDGG